MLLIKANEVHRGRKGYGDLISKGGLVRCWTGKVNEQEGDSKL